MKGNKTKLNGVPCVGNLWIVRHMKAGTTNFSKKLMQKCYTTHGFNFNKTAKKMRELGFRPNIQEHPSELACLSFGKGKHFK